MYLARGYCRTADASHPPSLCIACRVSRLPCRPAEPQGAKALRPPSPPFRCALRAPRAAARWAAAREPPVLRRSAPTRARLLAGLRGLPLLQQAGLPWPLALREQLARGRPRRAPPSCRQPCPPPQRRPRARPPPFLRPRLFLLPPGLLLRPRPGGAPAPRTLSARPAAASSRRQPARGGAGRGRGVRGGGGGGG
jgi:hypothetical protein